MYISCQTRDGDLDTFFEHENHAWPPSLAENNEMRPAKKAELLTCLESLAIKPPSELEVDVKTFDRAAVVPILEPNKRNTLVKTFSDYSRKIFLPYISRQ